MNHLTLAQALDSMSLGEKLIHSFSIIVLIIVIIVFIRKLWAIL